MDGTLSSTDAAQSSGARPTLRWKLWAQRAAVIGLIAIGVVYAARLGLDLRRWIWETTAPVRVTADLDRAFDWGRRAVAEGYLNQYEKMQSQQPRDVNWLDYPPLKLGIMTIWADWATTHFPQVKTWRQDASYELTAPLLRFNLFMESVGIVSAFFLTRLWARRGFARRVDASLSPAPVFQGWIPGLFAAGLLWFNPAILIGAYGWPGFDVWVAPVFILAVLLASLDWWFTAGVALGVGAMLKGQQAIAVPVLFAWAVLLGRPIAALRTLCGVTIAVAVVASPWLFTYLPADRLAAAREIQGYRQAAMAPDGTFAFPRVVDGWAIVWVAGVLAVSVAAPLVARMRITPSRVAAESEPLPISRKILYGPWLCPALAVLGTFAWTAWPWMLSRNRDRWLVGEMAGLSLAAATRWLRPRGIPVVAAGAVGVAMLFCMSVFHGSSAWYDCGFRFGTIHFPVLATGHTDNLPAILKADYDWSDNLKTPALVLPAHSPASLWSGTDLTVGEGELLRGIFYALLVISCVGVGVHARNRDPRFLIAIVTPWLMFFCFPAQIDGRYLLFAGSISCVCAGISTGITLLGVFLSFTAALMTLHEMLTTATRPNVVRLGTTLHQQLPSLFDVRGGLLLQSLGEGTSPDLGFAVLLTGFIFLYFTLAPRRRALPGSGT